MPLQINPTSCLTNLKWKTAGGLGVLEWLPAVAAAGHKLPSVHIQSGLVVVSTILGCLAVGGVRCLTVGSVEDPRASES